MDNTTKEEKESAPSFRELFVAYSKFGSPHSDGKSITLTQSDKWMKTAGLFGSKTFCLTDTLIIYGDSQKKLNYKQYVEYLEKICNIKKLDFAKVREKLEKAGLPKRVNLKETWDFSVLKPTKKKKKKKKDTSSDEL